MSRRYDNSDYAIIELASNKINSVSKTPFKRTIRVLKERLEDGTCIVENKFNFLNVEEAEKKFTEKCEQYKGYIVELLDMDWNILLHN